MLLEGKRGLILGIANKRSIAWGIAQAVAREGARLALTYQGERLEENVRELAAGPEGPRHPALRRDPGRGPRRAGRRRCSEELGGLDFVVHAVAFALREELDGEFLNTSREGYRIAQDISSYSLTALARRMAPLMEGGRQHRDPELPGRRARGAALQRDGRGQGRARDVGALPGRGPGAARHPRERDLGRAHQDPGRLRRARASRRCWSTTATTPPCARTPSRTRWATRRSSWSRASPAASPARSSTWTAAST